MYIYENPDWPHFIVDLSRTEKLEDKISELKYFLDGMFHCRSFKDRKA